MSIEKSTSGSDQLSSAKENTNLAVLRTVMGADRSLMAWVRTGLSLISFGFTIYKFLQYARDQIVGSSNFTGSVSNPKIVGLFMIGVGILCLVLGTLENLTIIKGLHEQHDFKHSRYSLLIAVIILIFGLMLFLAILLKGV